MRGPEKLHRYIFLFLTLELSAKLQNTRESISSDWKMLENQSARFGFEEIPSKSFICSEEGSQFELVFHCLP